MWRALLLILLVAATPSHLLSATSRRPSSHHHPNTTHYLTSEKQLLKTIVDGVSGEDERTGGSCPLCRYREGMKAFSLESIKDQILAKLGIEQPPNTLGKVLPAVPTVVMDQYGHRDVWPGVMLDQPSNNLTNKLDEDDDFHASTEKFFVFAHRRNHTLGPKLRHYKRLNFPFSHGLSSRSVERALLWVYVITGDGLGGNVTIHVASDPQLDSMSTHMVFPQMEGSWQSLDVRKHLQLWLQNRTCDFLTLFLQANGSRDGEDRSLIITDLRENNGTHKPFLEVILADKGHRFRRTTDQDCQDNSEEKRCCRYPLTVDFDTFGWDFIIAPRRYEAYYCSGDCSWAFNQQHVHTYLAQHALGALGDAHVPCCAPRKLSPISMLYFDDSLNIIFGHLPGMVVDRCGCS